MQYDLAVSKAYVCNAGDALLEQQGSVQATQGHQVSASSVTSSWVVLPPATAPAHPIRMLLSTSRLCLLQGWHTSLLPPVWGFRPFSTARLCPEL